MRIITKQAPQKNTEKLEDSYYKVYEGLYKGEPIQNLAEAILLRPDVMAPKACPFCGEIPDIQRLVVDGKDGSYSIGCENPLCKIRPQTSFDNMLNISLAWSLFAELMNNLRYQYNNWPIAAMKPVCMIALIEAFMGNMKVNIVIKKDDEAFKRWLESGVE